MFLVACNVAKLRFPQQLRLCSTMWTLRALLISLAGHSNSVRGCEGIGCRLECGVEGYLTSACKSVLKLSGGEVCRYKGNSKITSSAFRCTSWVLLEG